MPKSPAFQFYPKDYLGSMKVRLMTPEERGGYVDLLCHAWLDDKCSLPDDDTVLATLSGLGERWFDVKDKIRPCFRKRGKRLISTRLKEERKKQNEWHEKSRLGGMKSGKVRRDKALRAKGGSQMVGTKDEPNTNSSVCSLQSSSSKKKEDKDSAFAFKDSFEKTWKLYPLKIGKKQAFAHYKASVKSVQDTHDCGQALDNYLTHLKQPENDFKKPQHGGTWFNNWQDFVEWEEPQATHPQAKVYEETDHNATIKREQREQEERGE